MKIPMAVSFPWQRCTTVQPASLAKMPDSWTKDEVGIWLRWCTEEYSIDPIPIEKFDLNGKALCLLSRKDFIERVPKNGDVLYNSLNSLLSKQGRNQTGIGTATDWSALSSGVISDQSSARYLLVPPSSSLSSTVAKPPSNVPCLPRYSSHVPIQPHPYISVFTKHEEDHELSSMSRPSSSHIGSSAFSRPSSAPEDMRLEHMNLDVLRPDRSECRLLWEFIYQLLCNIKYSTLVCWEDKEEYVFRIINPTGLAELWGQQKNRTNMTYEKLSRALRYYYRMNIIKKVPGKRLTYRFLQPPMTIQKGQRGAKPHYKLNFESVNAPRADRDSPMASYSCSSNKASSKDDSSNTSVCEVNLEDVEVEGEDERVLTSNNPEIEAWVEQSNEQLNVTVSNQLSTSSTDLEKKMLNTQFHPSSIFSYPRSLYGLDTMNNTDFNHLHVGLGPEFHSNRQVHNPRDPFFLTASTSQIRQTHSFNKHQSDTRSTFSSNTDLGSKTTDFEDKEESAEQYLRRNVTPEKSLLRSRSYDFAQSFQAQQLSFRPSTAQSPLSVTQTEPEDLSTKERPPSAMDTVPSPPITTHVKQEMRASPDSPKLDH